MKVITAKINPDLDGYACMYAYREFLKRTDKQDVELTYLGAPSVEVEYLMRELGIKRAGGGYEDLIKRAEEIILVDSSDIKGMPEFNTHKVTEVIDHRPVHKAEKIFPKAKIQIEMVGAAATLITEKFIEAGINISYEATILLYCAVVIHSINLKGNMVTDRDKNVVQWLKRQAQVPEGLVHNILSYKSDWEKIDLKKEILKERKQVNLHGLDISIGQLEVINLEELVFDNKDMLLNLIEEQKMRDGTSLGFVNAIDLEEGFSILMTKDEKMQGILTEVLGVGFVDGMARSKVPYLRKEIILKISKIQDTISK